MSIPLFFNPPTYVKSIPTLDGDDEVSLFDLCGKLATPCRASGAWIQRPVYLRKDSTLHSPLIFAEPRNGPVLIILPESLWENRWQIALSIMAYAMFDLVARQSIIGQPWNRPT